jgi:hypothetical protein
MAKADSNRGAMRGKKTSKGFAKTEYAGITKITTGKAKAIKKAAAQKPGLETRGAKLTKAEAINRARDYQWQKAERYLEQRFDTNAGGPRAGEKSTAGPSKKNARKTEAVSKLARQKIPVKTPKVPVKPRGGLRGGGMLGGGGGLNRTNR